MNAIKARRWRRAIYWALHFMSKKYFTNVPDPVVEEDPVVLKLPVVVPFPPSS